MLSLVHVRSFLAVAETGSFKEAARRHGLSQPAISVHLMKLEATLGTVLIERGRDRCGLTRHGKIFLPFARSLVRVAARAVEALADRGLAIGASSNVGTYILPAILRDFTAATNTSPDVVIGANPEIAGRLERGEIDIALMEWWDGRPGFHARVWRRERIVVIMPPAHPWTEHRAVPFAALATAPLIGGEPGTGTRTLLQRALGEGAAALKVGLELGSTEAVKRAVMAGLGVSLALASAVGDEVAAGTLAARPLAEVDLAKDLVAVMPEPQPARSPAGAFAAFLTR